MPEKRCFAELIRDLRAGKQQAAAELVRSYEPEIRRLIRLSLTNPDLKRVYESADIFQSVFANFYVRLIGGQFDLEEPWQFIQLLTTMARNKIVDHLRRPANKLETAGPEGLAAVPARELNPSVAVEHEDLVQKVRSLLTSDERYLAEKRAEGCSWKELAAECGSTPDALRRRLERALDRISGDLGTA